MQLAARLAASARPPAALRFLFVTVALYAAFGKGFAYTGVPPVFIGEVLLLVVVLAAISAPVPLPRGGGAALAAILLGVAALQAVSDLNGRTAPPLEVVRGLAPVYYALIAFATYALLRRFEDKVGYATVAATLEAACRRALPYVLGALMLLAGLLFFETHRLPTWPTSGVRIFLAKPPEMAVTLVLLLPLLRIHKSQSTRPFLAAIWLLIAFLVAFRSRGALLGLLAGGFCVLPQPTRVLRFSLVAAAITAALYVSGLSFSIGTRPVSFEAANDSVQSLISDASDEQQVSNYVGTKVWREAWWDRIWSGVVTNRQVLHGHGWGDNLAIRYGSVTPAMATDPLVLRLPHNLFFSIAGRAGLIMAVGLLVVPVLAIVKSLSTSRDMTNVPAMMARGGLVAMLVVALTDTYVESPQGGIQLWALVGLSWWMQAARNIEPTT